MPVNQGFISSRANFGVRNEVSGQFLIGESIQNSNRHQSIWGYMDRASRQVLTGAKRSHGPCHPNKKDKPKDREQWILAGHGCCETEMLGC